MRLITEKMLADLESKMITLSGPRQSGKTTLVRNIAEGMNGLYLNWDIREDQKIIREMSWDKSLPVVVFDEFHKFIKWKNHIKGLYDQYKTRQRYIVTGSAKLETFRKSGDALTGRFFNYRLHPLDTAEIISFFNAENLSSNRILARILETGGFPESYLNPENSPRLRNNRFDLVLQEDLRDLSRVSYIKGVSTLIELLRERVGSTLNFDNLSKELSVSAPTVKSWIELLERLYVIFLVHPYTKGLSRSLKKECKAYFYDCAAAYNGTGARLENAVACTLLKYLDFNEDTKGDKGRLCFFRDREKREVDFVVEINRKVQWTIEVKTEDLNLHKNLVYLNERIPVHKSFQLVMNLDRSREISGVTICNAADWLAEITR